ncbi:SulP family inorganic anion transporter [Nocardia sp. NBC_00511]|uniref:SulP family inorganic anion transporter n=1 Tax=Nocardia sp. NBC_00511 TaxID=2903591 RepID=UPI0030E55F42
MSRLARCRWFVSHAVLTGLLIGMAVKIALAELPGLTGVRTAETDVAALRVISHPGRFDGASLLIGGLAVIVLIGLRRHRPALPAAPLALLVPTAVVALARLRTVRPMSEVGGVRSLPLPAPPGPGPAVALAASGAVAFVMVAAIGRPRHRRPTVARPQRSPESDSGTGYFGPGRRGHAWSRVPVPVRAWTLLAIATGGRLLSETAMPAVAAVYITGAVLAVRRCAVGPIWNGGTAPRVALTSSCCAALALPVTEAVAIGALHSVLQQFNREDVDLRLTELRLVNGALSRVRAPVRLRDNGVTVLEVRGSARFAGTRTLRDRLPAVAGRKSVVVIRLDGPCGGHGPLSVLAAYAERLERSGGRLYLNGIDPGAKDFWTDAQLDRAGVALVFATGPTTPAPPLTPEVRLRPVGLTSGHTR